MEATIDSDLSRNEALASTPTPSDPDHEGAFLLENMHLRKVVREAHSQDIRYLAYYCTTTKGDPNTNLLASVASNQACIYDNENCGDHLDMIYGYMNSGEYKGELFTCCWIRKDEDPCLVIAGADPVVQVIGLRDSRVLEVLPIDDKDFKSVVELSAYTNSDSHLAALIHCTTSSHVYVWNVRTLQLVAKFSSKEEITSIVLSPNNDCVFSSSLSGAIEKWNLPEPSSGDAKKIKIEEKQSIYVHDHPIDQIVVSSDLRIFAKSTKIWQTILVLNANQTERLFHIRIYDSGPQYRMSLSMNDAYLCLGSPSGNITIYYTENGRVAKTLECSRNGRRLRQCAIRSAMFSNNSRYIAHSGPEGMLFRWDFVDPEYVKLFDNHKK